MDSPLRFRLEISNGSSIWKPQQRSRGNSFLNSAPILRRCKSQYPCWGHLLLENKHSDGVTSIELQNRWLQQNGMEGMQRWSRGSNCHLNMYVVGFVFPFLQETEVIGYYRPAGPCVEHLQMFRWGIRSPVSLPAPCDEQNGCTTGCSGKYQPALPASCLKSVLSPPTHPSSESQERTGTSAITASISHVTEQTASFKLSLQAPWSPGPQSQIISTIISHFVYTKTQNWQRGTAILHRDGVEGSRKKCLSQESVPNISSRSRKMFSRAHVLFLKMWSSSERLDSCTGGDFSTRRQEILLASFIRCLRAKKPPNTAGLRTSRTENN